MIAELHIQTAIQNNKTFLKKAYHTTPFKIVNITEDKTEKTLRLMLMSSSPGILDGDEYNINIEVAEGCLVDFQTQSYQRLFKMTKGATQNIKVLMERCSSFCYLPHPTVPHEASDFVARNKIYLSEGCNLIWGEILTCGRNLKGEEFKFTRYHNITEVYLKNKLIIKENQLLRPFVTDVNAIGQLEGFTHQSSLIYLNQNAPINPMVDELNALLSTFQEIEFGVSALQVNGLIVRILGFKGEQLYKLQKAIADFVTSASNPVNVIANKKIYAD